MIMTSKYDSYCKECGRPIFMGDFINYDRETKKVKCVCCHENVKKEEKCPHWAVAISSSGVTSSNRYKAYSDKSYTYTRCCNCGKELERLRLDSNTRYIQEYYSERHGRSNNSSSSFVSFIKVGAYNQNNNPDEMAELTLLSLLNRGIFDQHTADIAKNHLLRIKKTSQKLEIKASDLSKYVKTSTDNYIYVKISERRRIVSSSIENIYDIVGKLKPEQVNDIMRDIYNSDYEILANYLLISYLTSIVNDICNSTILPYIEAMERIIVSCVTLKLSKHAVEAYIFQIRDIMYISNDFLNILLKYMMYNVEQDMEFIKRSYNSD